LLKDINLRKKSVAILPNFSERAEETELVEGASAECKNGNNESTNSVKEDTKFLSKE